MSESHSLAAHYHQALRDDAVLEQIKRHYPDGATPFQLAPLDQLHIGGLKASMRLFERLDPVDQPRVLDIGAGLGGLVRLGASLGFTMTGLDITHRFNALNQRIGKLAASSVDYAVITGDARRLPLSHDSFDAVIFQHSLMNMPALAPVLEEAHRVLRPGGRLVLHELTRGNRRVALQYPVPWAASAEHTHLLTLDALLTRLRTCGFMELEVKNVSDEARAWRARQSDKEQVTAAPVLSPQWVFGERFAAMGKNLLTNLTNRAIEVVEIEGRC
ncbi:class I SAM-dependent methyltransferase [Halomonas sp. PAMB 3264]|uniref:class I SAM-dependent methyltransferase n=1 Tax=Halomonas sp. PAMB 3264 TaxID=3075222 RepID=UPI00289C771F|nr:class I SAM-dependent methyltransferase [Halomonas sp. PAMB 3264]WNL40775.1 class I SAM-dependent methyltransferase [Halomonas sp. PAMB 3264]